MTGKIYRRFPRTWNSKSRNVNLISYNYKMEIGPENLPNQTMVKVGGTL